MVYCSSIAVIFFFFFNDTATTEIYTLPYTTLFRSEQFFRGGPVQVAMQNASSLPPPLAEYTRELGCESAAYRSESTRLNSSHANISYAVFCLKKKKKTYIYISKHTQ